MLFPLTNGSLRFNSSSLTSCTWATRSQFVMGGFHSLICHLNLHKVLNQFIRLLKVVLTISRYLCRFRPVISSPYLLRFPPCLRPLFDHVPSCFALNFHRFFNASAAFPFPGIKRNHTLRCNFTVLIQNSRFNTR